MDPTPRLLRSSPNARPCCPERIIAIRNRQSDGQSARLGALVLGMLALTTCGIEESHIAGDAEARLLGLTELQLHLCAGFPNKTETVEGVKLETYETTSSPPNVSLTLPSLGPLGGGGLGVSGSKDSYCRATFALVEGRVAALHYSGDTSVALGSLARCGPIVQHCVADPPAANTLPKLPTSGEVSSPATK
jgi:hypothetical protein